MSAPSPSGSPRDLLVSTNWLAGRLGDPRLRIIDCRYSFDNPSRGHRQYLESHIPGALYLDWVQDISEPQGALKMMAASPAKFQESMQRLGIGDESVVVAYDDEGGHYASRLWLLARRYGHDVRILDGGWVKWQREGLPTREEDEDVEPAGPYTVSDARPELLANADDVLRLKDQPNTVLLDVRRWTEFTGEEVRATYGGRIPGARWMLWQDNLDWNANRDFRSLDQIEKRYREAGITPDQEVVTYCQGGVRAAHTAFALTMLGYPNVRVYDGSWEEWGSRDDLPRETGKP